MGSKDFTTREIMIAAAAHEIHDGEVVFVVMRLPLVAFAAAKQTHAPTAIGILENRLIRDREPLGPIVTMGDPPNVASAIACTGLLDVRVLLPRAIRPRQRGRIALGFIGGAEIDRFGNLNTSAAPPIRLPGRGGAADIASLKFGILYIPDYYPERYTSASHYYGETMEQIQYEEELGFDGVFFAEHYVGGYAFPSPPVFASAVAQRTKRIRLGTGVTLSR
jgi:glutaconate CoA-transferase subunit B